MLNCFLGYLCSMILLFDYIMKMKIRHFSSDYVCLLIWLVFICTIIPGKNDNILLTSDCRVSLWVWLRLLPYNNLLYIHHFTTSFTSRCNEMHLIHAYVDLIFFNSVSDVTFRCLWQMLLFFFFAHSFNTKFICHLLLHFAHLSVWCSSDHCSFSGGKSPAKEPKGIHTGLCWLV